MFFLETLRHLVLLFVISFSWNLYLSWIQISIYIRLSYLRVYMVMILNVCVEKNTINERRVCLKAKQETQTQALGLLQYLQFIIKYLLKRDFTFITVLLNISKGWTVCVTSHQMPGFLCIMQTVVFRVLTGSQVLNGLSTRFAAGTRQTTHFILSLLSDVPLMATHTRYEQLFLGWPDRQKGTPCPSSLFSIGLGRCST